MQCFVTYIYGTHGGEDRHINDVSERACIAPGRRGANEYAHSVHMLWPTPTIAWLQTQQQIFGFFVITNILVPIASAGFGVGH